MCVSSPRVWLPGSFVSARGEGDACLIQYSTSWVGKQYIQYYALAIEEPVFVVSHKCKCLVAIA